MQSQDTGNRVADAVNHPGAAEWMAYFYDELAPERKRELHAHAAQCAACGEKLNQWRTSLMALDDWKLPALPRKTPVWQSAPMLKWAAAAAMILSVGFVLGQMSSTNGREVAELKTAVAQLAEQIGNPARNTHNQAVTITKQTHDELVQLLADFSKLNEERRTEDRRVVGLALREMDLRLGKLRTELETVALNTESGFRQTKEGLTTLASYTVADHGDASDFKSPRN